ncbi:SDR family oxidoreductase [Acuticoccus kandeliae]|uniref:SDR family oxidoreductase n=1 Tax=Acuticoccus kandeliae TaxID=2073160 RepID=UPI000D3E474C|nr:SDR family oxidoreductase [Acuticoccus kandeliae]
MPRLQGKTIIVTGASSGIGEAAARLFAAEGARLVIGARRADRLAALAGAINEVGPGRAVAVAGDVREEAHAAALVDAALTHFGALDGAFNNAGAVGALAPAAELARADWEATIATNLTSGFLAARHQIPALKAAGGGAIVFTGSFVGHTLGLPGMAAYAAAKAGLVGLTQVLSAELGGAGIRVNALLPGGTHTAAAGDDPAFHDWVRGIHALKRMAAPEEIARAALFLLSEDASFLTGAAILADGGVSVVRT